jgi:hypothetical protein
MRIYWMLLWAATFLLSGCAGIDVHTDYDNAVDFSRYTTYFWKKLPESDNSLMNGRIVSAVDGQLQARGWRNVPENEAQTAFAAIVTVQDGQRVDTFHNDWGPAWNGWGYGQRMTAPHNYWGPTWRGWGSGPGMSSVTTSSVVINRVGTLVIDLYDTTSKNAIWRGSASGFLTDDPAAIRRALNEGIQQMFANFPPGAP